MARQGVRQDRCVNEGRVKGEKSEGGFSQFLFFHVSHFAVCASHFWVEELLTITHIIGRYKGKYNTWILRRAIYSLSLYFVYWNYWTKGIIYRASYMVKSGFSPHSLLHK